MPLPSSFSLPVNTIVHEPDTGRSSRVPVNEHDPFTFVPPISFTFPVIVTVVCRARPGTEADAFEANPTTSTNPATTLDTRRPGALDQLFIRSP